jgi:hypothetical protein
VNQNINHIPIDGMKAVLEDTASFSLQVMNFIPQGSTMLVS